MINTSNVNHSQYAKHKGFFSAFAYITLFLIIAHLWGCSHSNETKEPVQPLNKKSLKLLILGVDGLAPTLVNQLLSAGRMPNLSHIMNNGSTVTIRARGKLNSPVIWTTIATGVSPKDHGITGFTIDETPVNSTFRKVPALWNILNYNNIKTATLGWWASWPAEKDGGIIISDLAYWGTTTDKIYPDRIIDTEKYNINNYLSDISFLPRFTQYPYLPDYRSKLKKEDWSYRLNSMLEERLVRIYYRDKIYTDVATELLHKEKPQVLSLYLRGVDYVQHAFWQFMEPEPFRKAGWVINETEANQLKNIIPEYYAYIDELIGKLLPYCDAETYIYVISDHGFEASPQLKHDKPGLDLSGDHNESTIFVLSGPEITKHKKVEKEVFHEDFLPTVLYTIGVPIAKNIAGRYTKEYFTDLFQKKNLPKYIQTYNTVVTTKARASSKQDDEIIKNLRSLGYIK